MSPNIFPVCWSFFRITVSECISRGEIQFMLEDTLRPQMLIDRTCVSSVGRDEVFRPHIHMSFFWCMLCFQPGSCAGNLRSLSAQYLWGVCCIAGYFLGSDTCPDTVDWTE
jgi:hypothetical protein